MTNLDCKILKRREEQHVENQKVWLVQVRQHYSNVHSDSMYLFIVQSHTLIQFLAQKCNPIYRLIVDEVMRTSHFCATIRTIDDDDTIRPRYLRHHHHVSAAVFFLFFFCCVPSGYIACRMAHENLVTIQFNARQIQVATKLCSIKWIEWHNQPNWKKGSEC